MSNENYYRQLFSPLGKKSIDLESIRNNFRTYLKENNIIKDVDYLGSNISLLIDIISYGIYNINTTNALISNETMLPTATIRQNIIELAKTLGYTHKRRISARANVNIGYNEFIDGQSITIPKYTRFILDNYEFINKEDLLISSTQPAINIDLYEGIVIDSNIDTSLHKVIESPSKKITINYKNIEHDGIKFYLKKSGESTFTRLEKIETKLEFDDEQIFYYEDYDSDTGWVNLITYYAGKGYILQPNDEYKIEIMLSNGEDANYYYGIELSDDETIVDNFGQEIYNIYVDQVDQSIGGAFEESSESIKENAPLFYNTGNRLTTETDYKSFLELLPTVYRAGAWGGETMPQHKKGRIYFSIVPQDGSDYTNDDLISKYLDYLYKKRIISTERVFWQPIYIYLDVDITILGTIKDIENKQKQIEEIYENIYLKNYDKFNVSLYYSKIVRAIESVFDNDIKASVDVDLIPRLRIHKKNFDTLYIKDELDEITNADEKFVLISIPMNAKQYFLVKGTEKIPVTNEKDIKSYMLNGWQLIYSEMSDLNIDFIADNLEYNKDSDKKLFYNGTEIGYYDDTNSYLWIYENAKNVIPDDPGFIDIKMKHDKFVNVYVKRNTFMKLGNIKYV